MSVRASMFFHVLKRGLLGRGNRPLIAFIALTVASTMITAMLSLYYGLENKLNRDFRSYGANVTLAAPDGQTLPTGVVSRAHSILGPRSEEHTSELQSQSNLVCRLLLEKNKSKHQ